jgi:hypothetical protein
VVVDRLDDVIADRRIIVADRLALGGEARQHRRRRGRAAQRQIEPELHPCPPRLHLHRLSPILLASSIRSTFRADEYGV